MFTIECWNCGQFHYVTGITKEKWEELQNENPETCDECGETL